MKQVNRLTLAALLPLLAAGVAHAAGGDVGEAAKQTTNWTAIVMFAIFVACTSPSGQLPKPNRQPTSTQVVVASQVSKTAWPLLVTTCQQLLSWVFPQQ
jgi:hypothetical protein